VAICYYRMMNYNVGYDTIRSKKRFNVDSKADCDRLNLAHVPVARNKNIKRETKTNANASAHLISSVQVQLIREGSPEEIRMTMEERICEKDEF